MSANGRISIGFADGMHNFNLAKLGQVLELEEKCSAGVHEIFNRLREQRWRFYDVRETIRLGLIGGGMAAPAALLLTQRYVDERPWAESVPVAQAILLAALVGIPDDPVGKDPADRAATGESSSNEQTGALSDPPSTDLAPVSDGTQGQPMTPPFGNSAPVSTGTTEAKG